MGAPFACLPGLGTGDSVSGTVTPLGSESLSQFLILRHTQIPKAVKSLKLLNYVRESRASASRIVTEPKLWWPESGSSDLGRCQEHTVCAP